MFQRLFFVLAPAIWFATPAFAAAMVNYTSTADLDPTTPAIELMPNTSAMIDISASSTGAPITNIGGMAFFFDAPVGLKLSNFEWSYKTWGQDSCPWEYCDQLPGPSVVSFAPAITFPSAPASIPAATMSALVIAQAGAVLDLPTGAQAFDTNGGSLQVTPSSGNLRFVVIPEPTSFAVLLIGVSWCVRRRERK